LPFLLGEKCITWVLERCQNLPVVFFTAVLGVGHLLKPTNQKAACRLENAILGEDGSKMVAIKEKGLRLNTATP
jgi:hypothetical protein